MSDITSFPSPKIVCRKRRIVDNRSTRSPATKCIPPKSSSSGRKRARVNNRLDSYGNRCIPSRGGMGFDFSRMVMGNENCPVDSSSDDSSTSSIIKNSNEAAAGYHCCLQSSLIPNAVRQEVKCYHLLTCIANHSNLQICILIISFRMLRNAVKLLDSSRNNP